MRLTAPKLGLNLRTTGAVHVTLYGTWCLSDLFTRPHGQVALRSRCGHYIFFLWFLLLWSPYGIGQTIYIFMLWFVLLSSFFIPRLISVAADWMSAILPHMVWP